MIEAELGKEEENSLKGFCGWMALGAVTAGVFFLRSEYERDCLVADRYVIRSPKIKSGKKTVVFLTDLHNKEFGKDNERLIRIIEAEQPDAVLVGGDMIVAKAEGDTSTALKLLTALAEKYPVYCGNGNHEGRLRRETKVYGTSYREYRRKLEEAGVTYLSDAHVRLSEDIVLYGVDLLPRHYGRGTPKMEPGFLERVLGEPKPEAFHLLLAHSPVFFEEYARWGADLTLAGHFHGGTIRLPFLGGLMTPQYQFFYPWCAGIFSWDGDHRMIVGRGLGTHSINIRFNDKPQVVVVRIENPSIF